MGKRSSDSRFDNQSKCSRQRFLPFIEGEKLMGVEMFGQTEER